MEIQVGFNRRRIRKGLEKEHEAKTFVGLSCQWFLKHKMWDWWLVCIALHDDDEDETPTVMYDEVGSNDCRKWHEKDVKSLSFNSRETPHETRTEFQMHLKMTWKMIRHVCRSFISALNR